MTAHKTVLLVGGTGRTGRRVLEQLLSRGVRVRAIVRSARKLPAGAAENAKLTVVEADLLSLGDEELRRHVLGCDAVISCLGHVISFRGVFGPPRDLVTQAASKLCQAIAAVQPAKPVKVILMSSVSVHRPGGLDTRRGSFDRAVMWILRGLVPASRDNQQAADFFYGRIGTTHPCVQWVVVRPDTLLDGDVSDYALHEGLISSLARPDSTNMANVAHFMCELAENPAAWNDWAGKLPVIVNASPAD